MAQSREPNYNASNYDDMPIRSSVEDPSMHDEQANANLRKCGQCGRSFNPTAYEKHAKVCSKVFVQKRKAFNSSNQRVDGAAKQAKGNPDPGQMRLGAGGKKPVPKWKLESQAFRANLKAARIDNTDSEEYEKAAALASSYNQQSMAQCPHCGRKFNDDAAARHIPICERNAKNSRFKKAPGRR
jgi:hypothetical protein